jgi:hypothetical protein
VQAVASGDAKLVVATLPKENNNVDARVQANADVNAAAAEYKDEQQRLVEKAEKQRALEEAHAKEDARQPLAPRCLPSTVRPRRPFTTTVRLPVSAPYAAGHPAEPDSPFIARIQSVSAPYALGLPAFFWNTASSLLNGAWPRVVRTLITLRRYHKQMTSI